VESAMAAGPSARAARRAQTTQAEHRRPRDALQPAALPDAPPPPGGRCQDALEFLLPVVWQLLHASGLQAHVVVVQDAHGASSLEVQGRRALRLVGRWRQV